MSALWMVLSVWAGLVMLVALMFGLVALRAGKSATVAVAAPTRAPDPWLALPTAPGYWYRRRWYRPRRVEVIRVERFRVRGDGTGGLMWAAWFDTSSLWHEFGLAERWLYRYQLADRRSS